MTYPTVRAVTSPELAYVRTPGQWSRLYLAVFKPSTIYTARLSSVPPSNDKVVEVSFASGSGVLADIKPGMTMYVGSTAGAYDLGNVRIRKAPIAGTFYIGEESDVPWNTVVSGGIFLTVVNEFDLWAKHMRTVDDSTFYIDHDVAYTDQNLNFDPVPIMGGHRVLKLVGATVNAQFDFSNSYCLGSSISAYSVSCPGASSISGGATSTPTITFNAPGWYAVYLLVTAANGKTFTGIRYVYVYSSDSMPVKAFQLDNCSEDYNTGGWSFDVTLRDEASLEDVPERTLCILFAEEYYGSTHISLGQLPGCENVVCVGKIAEERVSLNPEQSEVTLTIQGMQYWMGQVYAFPTGVIQVTGSASNWAEMYSPTVDKVVFRLLHWGCTATQIMDVYLTSDDRIAAELVSPASNLWSQIQELAFTSVQARSGVDRFSRMFVEVEPQLVPELDRSWATVMTITKADWSDSITMQRVVVSPTGMVDVSGVVVEASAEGSANFSLSPGHVFKHYGAPEVLDRLLLSSQSLSNQLTGLVLSWRNIQYPSTEMPLAANNRMIDCFPRQKLAWSVASGDSPRAFSINANFIPRRVSFQWDRESGFLSTTITLEIESAETISADGDVPGSGDLSSPPPVPPAPPIPDFGIILPSDLPDSPTIGLVNEVVIHDAGVGSDLGLLYCLDFAAGPTWQSFNNGLSTAQKRIVNHFFQTPSGACYCGYFVETDAGFFARAPSLGGTWTVLYDQTNLQTVAGNWGVKGALFNPAASDTVGLVIRKDADPGGASHFYLGVGGTFTRKTSLGADSFFRIVSFGQNKWLITRYGAAHTLDADGTNLVATPMTDLDFTPGHIRASSTGRTYHSRAGGGMYQGLNNLATHTELTDTDIIFGGDGANPYFSADPTGQFCMTRYTPAGKRGKSSDYGTTWALLPNLTFADYWFAYAGGIGVKSYWLAVGGTSVWYSNGDFGDTPWNNKVGNLYSLHPIPNLDMVKVLR